MNSNRETRSSSTSSIITTALSIPVFVCFGASRVFLRLITNIRNNVRDKLFSKVVLFIGIGQSSTSNTNTNSNSNSNSYTSKIGRSISKMTLTMDMVEEDSNSAIIAKEREEEHGQELEKESDNGKGSDKDNECNKRDDETRGGSGNDVGSDDTNIVDNTPNGGPTSDDHDHHNNNGTAVANNGDGDIDTDTDTDNKTEEATDVQIQIEEKKNDDHDHDQDHKDEHENKCKNETSNENTNNHRCAQTETEGQPQPLELEVSHVSSSDTAKVSNKTSVQVLESELESDSVSVTNDVSESESKPTPLSGEETTPLQVQPQPQVHSHLHSEEESNPRPLPQSQSQDLSLSDYISKEEVAVDVDKDHKEMKQHSHQKNINSTHYDDHHRDMKNCSNNNVVVDSDPESNCGSGSDSDSASKSDNIQTLNTDDESKSEHENEHDIEGTTDMNVDEEAEAELVADTEADTNAEEVEVVMEEGNNVKNTDDDNENGCDDDENKNKNRDYNQNHGDEIQQQAHKEQLLAEMNSTNEDSIDENNHQESINEKVKLQSPQPSSQLSPPPPLPKGQTIQFDNFVDLQTRLVLLPYSDDECIGAIVASYIPKLPSSPTSSSNGAATSSNSSTTDKMNDNDSLDCCNGGAIVNVDGFVLTGIVNDNDNDNGNDNDVGTNFQIDPDDDWMRKDYTFILSAIRDASIPTSLQFHDPEEWNAYQQSLISWRDTASNQRDDKEEKEEKHLIQKEGQKDEVVIMEVESTEEETTIDFTHGSSISVGNNSPPSTKSQEDPTQATNTGKTGKKKKRKKKKKKVSEAATTESKSNSNSAFKGRFQRWGSQLAAEATKAVIAGKSIAREKVNERFVTSEQQQPQQHQSQQQQLQKQQQPQQQPQHSEKHAQKPQESQHLEVENNQTQEQNKSFDHSSGTNGKNTTITDCSEVMEDNKIKNTHDDQNDKDEQQQGLKEDNKQISPIITPKSNSGIKEITTKQDKPKDQNDLCGMYLQTSFGKCLPLVSSLYKPQKRQKSLPSMTSFGGESASEEGGGGSARNLFKKAPPTISNTSVLVIRRSATDACPTLGYRYQWYKTSKPQYQLDQDVNRKSNSKIQHPDSIDDKEQETWRILDGATFVMFQPSVTDVGYRLKCVVTIEDAKKKNGSNDGATVTCELPFVIESDMTLFNAAIKSFTPVPNGTAGMLTTSFGNFIGRDENKGLQLRIDLHFIRDDKDQGGFYMTLSGNTEQPIQNEDKPIIEATASSYTYKAKSFYLMYRCGPSEDFNVLKLKSPSRLSRETFLIALGIAKYEGVISDVNPSTVLFPEVTDFPLDKQKSPVIELTSSVDGQKERDGRNTPELQSKPSGEFMTPVNSKMMAIETELEQDMVQMRDRLEAKNRIVSDLHHELTTLHDDYNTSKAAHEQCKKKLRLSEKRIESLGSDIQRMKKDFKAHLQESERKLKDQDTITSEYDKSIKALQNEKAVLSAAVEARDRKIEKMSTQLEEMETLRQKVVQGEIAQNQLHDLKQKHKAIKDEIGKMHEAEQNLTRNLEESKKNKRDLEITLENEKEISAAAKKDASIIKLQFQKARGERNMFKQKADSLSKEMSRICRNGRDISDIEKLITDHQALGSEVAQLRSEKKKALDEVEQSRTEYSQYVEAQIRVGADSEAVRALQRNIELERIVTEMTEYLNAKQMQLESVQDANRTLTKELQLMTKKYRDQNDDI